MAGRAIVAARCSMPTRSASSKSQTGCRSTPGRPTILHSNRRRCSSASRPRASRLPRLRKRRKRRDGDWQHDACSPPPCGERLGVLQARCLWLTPLPDPPPQGGRERRRRDHLTVDRTLTADRAPMTHPGEQFYPEGLHWDDPIARGTLPDLLSKAAVQYGARPAIEFRDRPISYTELEAMVEDAAAAYLGAGYGKNASVALDRKSV